MAGRHDARARLVAALAAIVIVSTTPVGAWSSFAAYGAIVAIAVIVSRIRVSPLAGRVALGLPFVVLATVLLWLAEGWPRAVSVGLKGVMALTIASLLALSSSVPSLITAVRKLGMPRSINLVSAMMLRYSVMLSEEFSRMNRARISRCGAPLSGLALFQVHSNQTGLLLVRSWERAERIHNAMLSRGFTGVMPEITPERVQGREVLLLSAMIVALLAARLVLG